MEDSAPGAETHGGGCALECADFTTVSLRSTTRTHRGCEQVEYDFAETFIETGLYYARARMYSAGLGRFISRDPKNSGRPSGGYHDGMSLYNGYFAPNGVDWTGMGYECVCGPDVTDWLSNELSIIYNWIERVNWFIDNNWADSQSAWNEPDFVRAKALRYSFLALLGAQLKYHPKTTFVTSGCPGERCKNTVTLDGKCIHKSEIGNFVYGAAARYFRMTALQAWGGGVAGNRGRRTSADADAISAGYNYGNVGGSLGGYLTADILNGMASDAPHHQHANGHEMMWMPTGDGYELRETVAWGPPEETCKPCSESVNPQQNHISLPAVDNGTAGRPLSVGIPAVVR